MTENEDVENPAFPGTSFPSTWESARHAEVMLLTDETKKTSSSESETIVEELERIRKEAKLEYLTTGVNYTFQPCVKMSVEELPKVYQVVNAFLDKGYRVQMNDGTQVVFETKMAGKACLELQQQILLQQLERIYKELPATAGPPYHKASFWCTRAGKEFAVKFAAFHQLRGQRPRS
jgi:hypothetical protein